MKITLEREPRQLDEVAVTATKIKMVMRDDTLVYDASAFVMPDGSMLDDLIAKLPYAKIDEYGVISVNGKTVSSLLVNGREFFKGDPLVALRNLPFYTVKDIKVYHRTPERFMYSKKERSKEERGKDPLVMNVTLKPQYIGGWLANVEAGAGAATTGDASMKWLGRMFAMHYNKLANIAIYANANNLNDDQQPGKKGEWDKPNMSAGRSTTTKAGISYNTVWADQDQNGADLKMDLTRKTGSYNSVYTNETFMAGGNTFTRGEGSSNSTSFQIDANGHVYRRFRPGRVSLSANYNYTHRNIDDISLDLNGNGSYKDFFFNDDDDAGSGFDFGNDRLLYRQDMKTNRKTNEHQLYTRLEFDPDITDVRWLADTRLNAELRYTGADEDRNRMQQVIYSETPAKNFNNLYRKSDDQRRYNYGIKASARTIDFKAGKSTWRFELRYDFSQHYSNSHTLGYISQAYPIPGTGLWGEYGPWMDDTDVTDKTNSLDNIHTIVPSVRYSYRGMRIDMESVVDFFDRSLDFLYEGTTYSIRRDNVIVKPKLAISASGNRNSITFSLESTKSLPRLFDMLDLTRRPQPLYEITGNPNLKPATAYTGGFYGSLLQKFNMSAFYTRIYDDRAGGSAYDATTGTTTSFIRNVDGNWRLSGSLGYNDTFSKLGLEVSNDLRPSLNHEVTFSSYGRYGYTEPTKVSYNRLELTDEFSARYRWKQISFTATVKARWNKLDKTEAFFGRSDYWDIDYGLFVTSPQVWGITFQSSIIAFCHRGYGTSGMNTTDWVWNLSASRALDRKKKFILQIVANDILQQFPNSSYSSSGMGRTERRSNTQPAYVIATLTYRLDLIPKNPLDKQR